MLSLETFSTAILEWAVELFSFVWEIPFALYEKYLLLSGRAGVYFHRGAVKSRQSASCWRQPILNATLLEKVFQIIWMNGVGVFKWTWSPNELHFQYSSGRTVPEANIYKGFQIFQVLCKGNIGNNQSETRSPFNLFYSVFTANKEQYHCNLF